MTDVLDMDTAERPAMARASIQGDAAHPEYGKYLTETCQTNPQVFIELSSICNFECFYCESPNHNRKSQVDDQTFYRALDQACKMTTQPVRLHCDGEPTVHAKFYEYAKAVNDRGLRVALVSNGSNLQERFVDLKMDIAVHLSTSPEEFKLRSKLSYDRYLHGMKNYIRAWRQYPKARQAIIYNFYLTSADRGSRSEIERVRNFANEFLTSVGLDGSVPADAAPNSNWFSHRKADGNHFRLAAKNVASGGMYPEVEAARPVSLPREFGFCNSPWKRLVILADGTLQACCLDLKGTLAYTRPEELATKSLSDLWNNDPRIAQIRAEALGGEMKHATCQKCLDRIPSREFYTAFQPKFELGPK